MHTNITTYRDGCILIHRYFDPSIHPSIHQSSDPLIHPPIHPSIRLPFSHQAKQRILTVAGSFSPGQVPRDRQWSGSEDSVDTDLDDEVTDDEIDNDGSGAGLGAAGRAQDELKTIKEGRKKFLE